MNQEYEIERLKESVTRLWYFATSLLISNICMFIVLFSLVWGK